MSLDKSVETLRKAIETLGVRADDYDSSKGENSMLKIVPLFNELTGHKLTVSEGWKFMILLKLVRSMQSENKLDNYVDGAAYFALASSEIVEEDEARWKTINEHIANNLIEDDETKWKARRRKRKLKKEV